MPTSSELLDRIDRISAGCGVLLQVTRSWEDEFRPGWYCRFRGVVHKSPALTIQVAGSLAVDRTGQREDELDLFLFANGDRLGRLEKPYEYLHRRGAGPLRWDDLDEGWQAQRTLNAVAMSDDR